MAEYGAPDKGFATSDAFIKTTFDTPETPQKFHPAHELSQRVTNLAEEFGSNVHSIEGEFRERISNVLSVPGPPDSVAAGREIAMYQDALMRAIEDFHGRFNKTFGSVFTEASAAEEGDVYRG